MFSLHACLLFIVCIPLFLDLKYICKNPLPAHPHTPPQTHKWFMGDKLWVLACLTRPLCLHWTCSSRFKLIFPLELWKVSPFSSSVQFCSNPGKKDGDSDQGRSNGSDEKWLHSGYTLEVWARRLCQWTVRERNKA